MNNEGKLIAAICAAPLVLKHADVLLNKKATIYPDDEFINLLGVNYLNEPLIVDKNIITAAGVEKLGLYEVNTLMVLQ